MITKSYSTKSNAKAAARRAGEENPILTEFEGGRWTWAVPRVERTTRDEQDSGTETDEDIPAFLKKGSSATAPQRHEPTALRSDQMLPPSSRWDPPAVDPDLLQLAKDQGPLVALITLMGTHDISEAHTGAREAVLISYSLGVETAAKVRRKPRATRDGAPSKREIAASLLQRREGATSREILDATGWPTVSIPALAKASKLVLRQEKDGKVTRYYGEAA
jgi:hypothetical protein